MIKFVQRVLFRVKPLQRAREQKPHVDRLQLIAARDHQGDTGAGMVKGQGSKEFGAGWYVLNAKGSKIDND